MSSFLLAGMVGISLALLYFAVSAFYSSKIISSFKTTSVALALVGFIVRLTVLATILYGVSLVKAIHFQTTLISFAIGVTICLAWKAVQSYRKLGSLKTEPTKL